MTSHRNNKKNQAYAIHRALMVFQYKNRFIGQAYGQDCDLLDSHMLSEIDARKVSTFRSLVTSIGLSPSLISRRTTALQAAGYIDSRACQEDGRVMNLSLTRSGVSLLKKIDKTANPLMEQHCLGFQNSDIASFRKLIHRFAEHHLIPPAKMRRGDIGLRSEMRTLARAMGVLGREYMGSKTNSTNWMILNYISLSLPPLSIQDLSELLHFSHGGTSKVLMQLRKLGVLRTLTGQDRRKSHFEITKKGVETLQKVEDFAARHIEKGMKDFSGKERSVFVKYVQWLAYGAPGAEDVALGYGFHFKLITQSAQRDLLRKAFVSVVAELEEYPFRSSLFSEHNVCGILEHSGRIFGGVEISCGSTIPCVENYFVSSEITNPLVLLQFALSVFRHLARTQNIRQVEVGRFFPFFAPFVKANFLHTTKDFSTKITCIIEE